MTIEEKYNKINHINDYFSSIGESLAKNIENNIFFQNYRVNTRFHFKKLYDNDIKHYIKKLKNTKSTGPDEISTEILKKCATEITPYLTSLINTSLKSSTFPENLKINKITPIQKSTDDNSISNYRPISVSSIISKILETIVNDQLTQYLEKYSLISKNQYGFRKHANTTSAIFDMITYIEKEMDKKNKIAIVFFDLTKAFDTVDRKILLKKLSNIGIIGETHN